MPVDSGGKPARNSQLAWADATIWQPGKLFVAPTSEIKRISKMTRNNFWTGFAAGVAAGAVAGIAGVLAFKGRMTDVDGRIIRLEKSINIGRSVSEVFAAWSDFERLPRSISFVESVQRSGDRCHWRVSIDGRAFEWDAQITQTVPNESLGWKSLNGPHHTGRISFAPLA